MTKIDPPLASIHDNGGFVMPTDDEIIYDWRRHDAFRFRSVLIPILLMLLLTTGQWSSSPWVEQVVKRQSVFKSWGTIDEIIRQVWGYKVFFFGLAPLSTVLFFNPIQSRRKMRFVIGLTLSILILQAMAFLNTSKGLFLFSIAGTSFAFGLTMHSVIITLLNWFPDFSIFVFATVALVSMLSHWINLSLGLFVANSFSLPTLPIFQAILFMATVIPLHFFIQAPPLYIPLFIRSMLHAASLPTASTLPLPTTLGIAARIPKALGKLQQWKKKLKSKGARRGYGELINEEDIDQIEEIEMDVASGFDLHDNDALDDLYSGANSSGNNSSITRGKSLQKPSVPNNTKKSQNDGKECQLGEIVVHSQDDALAIAAATQPQQPQPQQQQQQQQQSVKDTRFSRAGDDEDNGDPQFALGDDDFEGFQGAPQQNSFDALNVDPKTTTTTTTTKINSANTHSQRQKQHPVHSPHHLIDKEIFDPAQIAEEFEDSSQPTTSPHHANYRRNVGSALSAVVSQLDQYTPLGSVELLSNKPVQIFIIAAFAPLLFPFLLTYLTPLIYSHLQNRDSTTATNIFHTTYTVCSIICAVLLISAQFFGNKGLLTTSAILLVGGTLLWAPCSIIGGQHNPATTKISYNPLHVLIGMIYVGAMTYGFLLFPALQKYFHDENVRVLSAFVMFGLSITYIFSPILLGFRDVLLDQASYPAPTKIAINALAYNWVARCGFLLTVLAIFALYRLRPLAVTERRYKS
jgi:MFS family permease